MFQYLATTSSNTLNIDSGLIETLNIRLTDTSIMPDALWFESICKYVYEKIKNEDIFLTNFYKSSSYRKLLLELEFCSSLNVDNDIETTNVLHSQHQQLESGSDSNSGDLLFDDEIDFVALDENNGEFLTTDLAQKTSSKQNPSKNSGNDQMQEYHGKCDTSFVPTANTVSSQQSNLLDIIGSGVSKHYRSHSDCTSLVKIEDMPITPINRKTENLQQTNDVIESTKAKFEYDQECRKQSKSENLDENVTLICPQQRLSAKIINTAINCEGQFAVYAIQVTIIEDNQQKSWHVYRRYSRFLDLKKLLVKRVSNICFSFVITA